MAVVLGVLAWVWADASVRIPVVVILTVAYPYLVYASVWAWDVVVRLDAARATEADLAVTRERLRFAADLHDIQGHSLQVIALKAELAERLLEARPEAAAEQISEVRGEAADALARARELARGYRATGIEDELANARDVLAVAGFDCSTEIVELPDDAAVRSLFGRVLREATTNVLRHADPGPVEITTGRRRDESGGRDVWRLEVANQAAIPFVPAVADGHAGGLAGDHADGQAGAGLVGLAERVEALSGRLTARVSDGAGPSRFVLTVSVPVGRGAESS